MQNPWPFSVSRAMEPGSQAHLCLRGISPLSPLPSLPTSPCLHEVLSVPAVTGHQLCSLRGKGDGVWTCPSSEML